MKRHTEAGDLGGPYMYGVCIEEGMPPQKSAGVDSVLKFKWMGCPKLQKWLQASSLDGPLAQHIEPENLPELWAPQKIAA